MLVIGEEKDVADKTWLYVLVVLPGQVFFALTEIKSKYLAGIGQPFIGIFFRFLSVILQISLATVFILIAEMGVIGAALSLTISHFVIFCLHWIVVYFCCDHIDNQYLSINLCDDRVYRWSGIKTILKVAG